MCCVGGVFYGLVDHGRAAAALLFLAGIAALHGQLTTMLVRRGPGPALDGPPGGHCVQLMSRFRARRKSSRSVNGCPKSGAASGRHATRALHSSLLEFTARVDGMRRHGPRR